LKALIPYQNQMEYVPANAEEGWLREKVHKENAHIRAEDSPAGSKSPRINTTRRREVYQRKKRSTEEED